MTAGFPLWLGLGIIGAYLFVPDLHNQILKRNGGEAILGLLLLFVIAGGFGLGLLLAGIIYRIIQSNKHPPES